MASTTMIGPGDFRPQCVARPTGLWRGTERPTNGRLVPPSPPRPLAKALGVGGEGVAGVEEMIVLLLMLRAVLSLGGCADVPASPGQLIPQYAPPVQPGCVDAFSGYVIRTAKS